MALTVADIAYWPATPRMKSMRPAKVGQPWLATSKECFQVIQKPNILLLRTLTSATLTVYLLMLLLYGSCAAVKFGFHGRHQEVMSVHKTTDKKSLVDPEPEFGGHMVSTNL